MGNKQAGVINFPATVYDTVVRWFVMRGQEQKFRGMVADLVGLRPGEVVLDVGCGTGTMALLAKRRVGESGRVVGVDPSPRLLTGARRKAEKFGLDVDFREESIERLDLPDGAFDVAMGTFMVHHMPDETARAGFVELHRVIKPGGRLLLIDFKRPEGDHAATLGQGTLGVQELRPVLRQAGFADIRSGDMPFRIRSVARTHTAYGYVTASRN